MMLIAMKPQKSQLQSVFKYTAGQSISFKRDVAIMYGYQNFDAMLVGGGGGSSSVATGPTPDRYQNGGGGGSSKLVSGLLSSLSAVVTGVVGWYGANALTNGAASTAGGRGENTTFGPWTAYGGYGGKAASSAVANRGGEGANPDGSAGPAGGAEGSSAPVNGSWNAGTGEGSGGGGGAGAGPLDLYQVGGSGAGGAYLCPGGDSAAYDAAHGGGGGGASVTPLTGVPNDYYGTGRYDQENQIGGVVVVKLS